MDMDPVATRIPVELLLHVISCYAPGNPKAILSPAQAETKMLLSFSLVCRATYPLAARLLRQFCMHIATETRLRDLLVCLSRPRTLPFAVGLRGHLDNITSVYLAPFGSSLDDQPTAIWVRELFCLVCSTLRRLTIDMPLRSLYPAEDHLSVRRTLRDGFERLTALEEFVSVRDELYLDLFEPELQADEPPVWALWPRLSRLALYNADANERFWARVAGMARLETVVLTRADSLESTCVKSEFFRAADRPLRLLMVNVSSEHREVLRSRWKTVDPGGKMQVLKYDVPTSFYGDEDVIGLCQDWVKAGALRGTLFDWEGVPVEPADEQS